MKYELKDIIEALERGVFKSAMLHCKEGLKIKIDSETTVSGTTKYLKLNNKNEVIIIQAETIIGIHAEK